MGKRVSLFVTCMVDQLFPKVGMAMAGVLERLGYQVDFPESQTCCGQPAFNSGYRGEARMVARHFLDTFESSETIVVSFRLLHRDGGRTISPSCSPRSRTRWRGCMPWKSGSGSSPLS